MESSDAPNSGKLTALQYDASYYEEHVKAGLDYLGHGYWQESYGLMVSEATMQSEYEDSFFLDAGCACGSILMGFKKTGVFRRILGIDLSDYMTDLGRRHFGFCDEEIIAGSITDMPVESASVTLLHSAQVLEHIPDRHTDRILDEFARVLRPGGRAFLALDAVRHGETVDIYMGDPTHVNIKPVYYWTEKLQARGLLFDIEAYNRFVRSERGPTQGDPRSFFQTYHNWSVWTLIRS